MERLANSKWFTKVLALVFALLLFMNANSEKRPSLNDKSPSISAVADKVPIQVKYDESKYYVTGFDPTTTVYLKSNNKVLLDSESHEQTRGFKVEADLTGYKEGTFEVPLKVKNLNGAVNAILKDQAINVTIEKRKTKRFKVTPVANDNLLKKGYDLESMTSDPAEVEITAGSETLKQIKSVNAFLEDDRDLSEGMTKKVSLVALDKDSNSMSVIMVPPTVNVKLKISAPSKSVPLEIKQSGKISSNIKSFEFIPEVENITVKGSRESLEKVDKVQLFIDTTSITKERTSSYQLIAPDGVEVEPKVVTVNTVPQFVKEDKDKNKD